jgi:hypothetical protein
MEIKIKIKIKDVEIEVEKEDLKELYDFLEKMFGEKVRDRWIPYDPYPWYVPYPSYPVTYTDTAGNEWKQWENSSGTIHVYCSEVK